MVSGSKVGGILGTGLGWLLFTWSARTNSFSSDIFTHQIAFVISAGLLLCVPFVLHMLIKKVPKENLRGYEAAYLVEKQRQAKDQQ